MDIVFYLLWLRYWSWPWRNTFLWLWTGSIWASWSICAVWSRGEARRRNGGADVAFGGAAPMPTSERFVCDVYAIISRQKSSIISRRAPPGKYEWEPRQGGAGPSCVWLRYICCICMVVDLCLALFHNFFGRLMKYTFFPLMSVWDTYTNIVYVIYHTNTHNKIKIYDC